MKSRVRKSLLTFGYLVGVVAWCVVVAVICALFGWPNEAATVLGAPGGAIASIFILKTWMPAP